MLPTFTLTEGFAFGSEYSWRLKDSQIRFRGSGEYERLVLHRIPASAEQIGEFRASLDLIQVWDWRSDYDPTDIGYEVMDGSSWTFKAAFDAHECSCGGENAYPSFANAQQTTINRGRFALLVAAMYECFEIEGHIQQAKLFIQRDVQQRNQNDS